MDPIYLIIVIILLGLAVMDLAVGVANDAVNFLQSYFECIVVECEAVSEDCK